MTKRNRNYILETIIASAICFGAYSVCKYLNNESEGRSPIKKYTMKNEQDNKNSMVLCSRQNGQYTISKRGIEIIKRFEGFRERVYYDVGGKATIGYGHLIKKGENYERVNEKEAERLLREDLKVVEGAINKYVKVKLKQEEYDALVSLVYNIGINNFKRSTLLQKLNKEDYNGAANEFNRWKNVNGKTIKGLENRREEERRLFQSK
ncbi:MAG: lysozyme [Candidatus Pacearchaeota archaeon]|nr:lysozyme [Candidatus Pacearchaeota archaeon]